MKNKRILYQFEIIQLPTRLSGLAKSHRLIRIEKYKEAQFLMLCEQIRLNEIKKQRADHQRDERREKRHRRLISN